MTMAWLFPGQGAQKVGMGRSIHDAYPIARETIEEAEDHLSVSLRKLLFEGPAEELSLTQNSQIALFVVSLACFRAVKQQFPAFQASVCAGHSLGEYSALVAAGRVSFTDGLTIVAERARLMGEACAAQKGAMAAVLGLTADQVQTVLKQLPAGLLVCAANFNCPGQVVISGTPKGVEQAGEALKAAGARRTMPLDVQGAFHSELMRTAQQSLLPRIEDLQISDGLPMVMNVTGEWTVDSEQIRTQMRDQVCSAVQWEKTQATLLDRGANQAVEFGAGVLAGLNKRASLPTTSVIEASDFDKIESLLSPNAK